MKINSIFHLLGGIPFLCGLMVQGAYAYRGKDSRNGDVFSSQGSIRVLVVFAEVTGDPNYNLDTWPWEAGKMPPDADQLFDADWLTLGGGIIGGGVGQLGKPVVTPAGPPSKPTKIFSRFFYDASFGKLAVKGDFYPELIQIPYNRITCDEFGICDYNQLVIDVLTSKNDLKSATGLEIPADFDAWTPTGGYLEKNNVPDGKIDNLVIIWRINSRLTTVNGSGRWVNLALSNYAQSICVYDFLTNVVVPHEFSHGLLGGNQYHNGGAGAGVRHFITNMGGYGILESYNHNLQSCNAWDRYRLGWKKNDAYPDIYACNTVGEVVNGDILYHIPSINELKNNEAHVTKEYVLRDFITTGDAIRIQLPYVGQNGEDPQWIWLENHVDDMRFLYKEDGERPMGVRINLQVGGDGFDNFDSRTNYYVPFSRFGRWDFDIYRTPVSRVSGIAPKLSYIPSLDSIWIFQMKDNAWYRAYTASDKSNPFTGNSLLEFMKYDANGDNKLQDREDVNIKHIYKDDVRIGGDYPIFGNEYDVFRVGDVLSLGTNPSTTPWLTHGTKTGGNACISIESRDTRKIYLNGLKIHIKEKRADGSVVVGVTQGYYTVDQNQRWCGDIVLNEKISLNAGKKIRLALGKTPVVKENPIVLNKKRYFTEPTVLTCKANSVLSLDKNSEIEVDSLCALVLKEKCILENRASSGSTLIRVKRGGTLIVEPGVSIGKGILFVLEKESYACVDDIVKKGMSCSNDGYMEGIHPYVRQTKKLRCVKGAKSGFVDEQETPFDSATVYQSFFDGNPVYNQVGENETKCGAYIPIYQKGLEGDTVVDGLSYHKMSVNVEEYGMEGNRVQFWVRESEAHDKVWVRLPWDTVGQEFLVVDMTLGEGDAFVMDRACETMTVCDTTWDTVGNAMIVRYKDTVVCKEICYVVDSVYHLEHPGGMLKHIRLSPLGYNGYTEALEEVWIRKGKCNWRSRHLEFIEGVGSNLGFVYHRLGVSYKDSLWGRLYPWYGYEAPTDYIVCMERDNAVYYEHPNAECMDCNAGVFDSWIDESGDPRDPKPANEWVRSLSRHLAVTPNPATETATLQWDASANSRASMTSCRVTLYDMQGVRLRSYIADRWPYTLCISDLTPGTYLLRVVPAEVPADGSWQATVRLSKR